MTTLIRPTTRFLRAPLMAAILAASLGAAAQGTDRQLASLLADQRWNDALALIDSQLKTKPNDLQLQMNRGAVLSSLNRNAEALVVFQKVAMANPQFPSAHNNMAVILAANGKYEEARMALERAIRTHPAYATAYENLGDLYSHMAGDAYRKALQYDKNLKTAKPKLEMVSELTALAAGAPGSPAPTAAAVAPNNAPVNMGASNPAAEVAAGSFAAATGAAALPGTRVAQAPAAAPPVAPKPMPAPAPAAAPAAAPVPAPAAVVAAAKPVPAPAPPPAPVVAAVAPKPMPAPAAPVVAAADNSAADVQAALATWAAAWSKRDMTGYAASYVPGFKGSKASHADWLADRKARIVPRSRIDVKVADVQSKVSGDRAEVSFTQQYSSDTLSNRSRKSISMQKIQGTWLIRDESGR